MILSILVASMEYRTVCSASASVASPAGADGYLDKDTRYRLETFVYLASLEFCENSLLRHLVLRVERGRDHVGASVVLDQRGRE